jgi:hypothetical protein
MQQSNEQILTESFRRIQEKDNPETASAMAALIAVKARAAFESWALDRLTAWVRQKWPKPANPALELVQYLPGFESMANGAHGAQTKNGKAGSAAPLLPHLTLSRRMPLKDGKSKPLGEMSVVQVRESIRLLPKHAVKKLDPMRDWLQDLANKMSPYSEKFYEPGNPVTVERYCELKRAGEPEPKVRTTEQRSAAIKELWAKKTKKERSEIARKRMADKKKRDGED